MNTPGPIKLSKRAKDQLAQLTRHTGIEHRNVLCRWALASQPRRQAPKQLEDDVALTIEWRTFAGDYNTAALALLASREPLARKGEEAAANDAIAQGLTGLLPLRSVSALVTLASGQRRVDP